MPGMQPEGATLDADDLMGANGGRWGPGL